MDSIVSVFLSAFIITEYTEDTYFIRDKVVITIFIFIVNKYNYETETIGSKVNNIVINNIIFKSSLS
jgi:hypothetical protein